jgi:hypothetical protein
LLGRLTGARYPIYELSALRRLVISPATDRPEQAFIKIKSARETAGSSWGSNELRPKMFGSRVILEREWSMRKAALALVAAAVLGLSAIAAPSPAEARWRGGGFFPAVAGGLIAGAVIGGIASNAYGYGYGPGYGYYGGGYAPAYYGGGYGGGYYGGGYAPAYYGGYAPAYYGGYYGGPVVRRVYRPAYAYGPRVYGPRYYRGYYRRW